MTLPVWTPHAATRLSRLSGERGGGAVECGVVGDAVEPAAVDDADPGAGEDADGVRVVLPAGRAAS